MTWHTITCSTPDCPAEGAESQLLDPAPRIICAGCGEQITDITPPIPEPDPEPDPTTGGPVE